MCDARRWWEMKESKGNEEIRYFYFKVTLQSGMELLRS
jgi:hypothetical protein